MNANAFIQRDCKNMRAFGVLKNKANFKMPGRIRPLNSMKNAYNANGSICKKLDI
jgi:hypothetical protein